jgi:hypothetical protein
MRTWFGKYGALMGLLLMGLALRIYVPGGMVLVGDDLSALLRTHYASWQEFVEGGIKTDVHPPGIQVFLFFWNRIFIDQAWWIKLPFIALSVLNVYLTWLLGRRLNLKKSAYLAALCMSALQFPVFYGQLARMYAPGTTVILGLSLIYVTSQNAIKISKKRFLLHGILLALAVYIHHLAALSAGIIWLTGILKLRPSLRREWAGAALLGFLLFLPALPLWINQFKLGGVGGEQGWLGAPKPDFFIDFFAYLFHYFIPLYLLAGLLFILALRRNAWFIGLLWFILPAATAFLYSVFRNPVLQFSSMHFSIPFFLLFLSSGIDRLPGRWPNFIIGCFLILVPGTLLAVRRHPYMQSKEPFKGIPIWMKHNDNAAAYFLCDIAPERWTWYVKEKMQGRLVLAPELENPEQLPNFDSVSGLHRVILGQVRETNPDVWAAIKFQFPIIRRRIDFTGGMIWDFNRSEIGKQSHLRPHFKTNWRFKGNKKGVFFGRVQMNLDNTIQHESDWLYQEVKMLLQDGNPPRWVTELRNGNERILWRSVLPIRQRGDTLWYASAIPLHDMERRSGFGKWQSYAWAKDSAKIDFLEVNVECWPGNRIMDAPFKKTDWK